MGLATDTGRPFSAEAKDKGIGMRGLPSLDVPKGGRAAIHDCTRSLGMPEGGAAEPLIGGVPLSPSLGIGTMGQGRKWLSHWTGRHH
jgi:hypothetical protein